MNETNKSSKQVCVDASLVLRLALGGPGQAEVEVQWSQWMDTGVNFIAPPLFAFEVTSAVWREVFTRKFTPAQGLQTLQDIFNQEVKLEYPPGLHERAWQIAQRFNQPATYDSHYVALAQYFGCEFWTLDRKLYKAVSSKLPWVHIIPQNN